METNAGHHRLSLTYASKIQRYSLAQNAKIKLIADEAWPRNKDRKENDVDPKQIISRVGWTRVPRKRSTATLDLKRKALMNHGSSSASYHCLIHCDMTSWRIRPVMDGPINKIDGSTGMFLKCRYEIMKCLDTSTAYQWWTSTSQWTPRWIRFWGRGTSYRWIWVEHDLEYHVRQLRWGWTRSVVIVQRMSHGLN